MMDGWMDEMKDTFMLQMLIVRITNNVVTNLNLVKIN
jgi:hypothetical protein